MQIEDTHARSLVSQYLDGNSELEDLTELEIAVKNSSLSARFDIFK